MNAEETHPIGDEAFAIFRREYLVKSRFSDRVIERILYVALLAALGASGFVYEWFRGQIPQWQLVGLICTGMGICFAAYRLALNYALRKS